MEQSIHNILKQYWNYDTFRPLQQDIIESVIAGNDTLALLPTGGGKSLCFQLPALTKDGLCLVVSPLIALMKDQVDQLQEKNINAAALHSGQHFKEQQLIIENAINGAYKFLYISPERLKTKSFKERLAYLNISLLAVDEAHCISQWGYDFRPEYLQIAEARAILPHVPIIALTASATQEVIDDIQHQLLFKRGAVFKQSFIRYNLSYVVNQTESKTERLLHILSRVKGSGLVYVRSRKQAQDLTQTLIKNNFSADYYHAGLSHDIRIKKQDAWVQNKTRIMVCTNAFGMGVNKPNCRIVVHYEIPESLESYYQEAGRAGRDQHKAFCVLLHHESDEILAKQKINAAFPEEKELKQVYNALCSYYQLPVGLNTDESFDFDITDFCAKFKLQASLVYQAIKILNQCDLIQHNESFFTGAKFRFIVNHAQLYKYQVEHEKADAFIKIILRSYGGVFNDFVPINEKDLAQKAKVTETAFTQFLLYLNQIGLADYQPKKDKPQITFLTHRQAVEQINLRNTLLKRRKEKAIEKIDAIIEYARNESVCRSIKLVGYFGEYEAVRCGICDVCLALKKQDLSDDFVTAYTVKIKTLLTQQPCSQKELINNVDIALAEQLNHLIRYLIDTGSIVYNQHHQLIWKSNNKSFLQ